MSAREDPRLEEARQVPVTEVVDRLGIGGLAKEGWELVGPCPLCGGRDRFAIHLRKAVYLCRRCMPEGGDMIRLVMAVRGLPFCEVDPVTKERRFPPLDFLCGPPVAIPPEEMERRRRRREAEEEKRAREEERYRADAIRAARRLWAQGQPPEGTAVERYLDIRGLPGILPRLDRCLRFHPALPYFEKQGARWVEIDRHPAMLAAIQAPDGHLICLHRTWLDLDRPKGKAVIFRNGQPALDRHGRPLKAKKTLGATKGGAIRLITPARFDTLVMGEGIETTLAAALAEAVPGAAYWAGVDLGNMSGRMRKLPGRRHSGLPDMEDVRAFVPPPWVKRLIFIKDGDSDPRMTRAKLESGLRRAMARIPGLRAQIVPAGEGVDLNDVLTGAGPSGKGEGVA